MDGPDADGLENVAHGLAHRVVLAHDRVPSLLFLGVVDALHLADVLKGVAQKVIDEDPVEGRMLQGGGNEDVGALFDGASYGGCKSPQQSLGK